MTRYVIYSHDTYGLGHFRRSSLLAAGLVDADPGAEVLLVTGSPRAQSFPLPPRVDTITLPSVTKDADGSYRPRRLPGPLRSLVELRAALIRSAVTSYRPDVLLVDHAPAGMGGELLPLLDDLACRSDRPRLVLGLRDIIDDAATVEADWCRSGTWGVVDRYDDILVYGDASITTTATELGLHRRCRATVSHTGYLAPAMPEPQTQDPFVLVTPGGGGDGHALLLAFLDAAAAGATDPVRSMIVTGPLLSGGRRAELSLRAAQLPGVELVPFTDRLRSLIASAVGVISMAGYNTVVEELAAATPALLVPRSTPRLEQTIRAGRLGPLAGFDHCRPDELDRTRVAGFVDRCLAGDHPTPAALDLDGVATAVAHLSAITAAPIRRTHSHV